MKKVEQQQLVAEESASDAAEQTVTAQPTVSEAISAPPPHDKTNTYALALILLSAIAFTANNVLIHVAQIQYSISVSTSVFVRCLVQSILASVLIVFLPNFPSVVTSLNAKQGTLLFLRGAIGSIALYLLYASFHYLPVADAVTVYFCTPLFTLLVARAVLSEPIGVTNAAAAIAGVIGAALIAHPGRQHVASADLVSSSTASSILSLSDRVIGTTLSLSSAALTAIVYTMVRMLSTSVHHLLLVLSQGACACVLSVALVGGLPPLVLLVKESVRGVVLLVAAGACGLVAQAAVNRSLQLCCAGPVVLVRNLEVPFTYAVGVLVLKETPSGLAAVGALLIVTAAVVVGVKRVLGK